MQLKPSGWRSASLTRAIAALEANPAISKVGELMRVARVSSGFAIKALTAKEQARHRAADLLRAQLARGPRRYELIEAAAEAAEIDEPELLGAADVLGVVTKRGE